MKYNKIDIFQYKLKGFGIDVVTFICLFMFLYLKQVDNSEYSEQSLSIFLLAFYMRYKQFGRVAKKIQLQYYFSSKASQILRLVKLLFYNIYIIHVLSCIWILIARNQDNLKHSWMGKYGIADEEWYVQFLNSFYFSTVTMVTVGYGDISPATSIEKIFSVITILSGCGVFAYSITEVGSIFKKLNEELEQKKDNMIIINGYMKKKKIPVNLQCQIRHYLEYYWNESLSEKVQKEQSIIDQLSNTLKENLKIEANRSLIQESPFFKNMFSEKTLNNIAQISTEQRCHPEEIVYRQGEIDQSSIYFIEKGSVQCVYYPFAESESKQNGQSINLKSKQYFGKPSNSSKNLNPQPYILNKIGDIEFLTGEKRIQQVRSLEFTTLIKIDRDKFIEIVKNSESDHQKFCMLRDDILLNKNYDPIKLKCSYCNYCKEELTWESNHFEQNCPLFHFIPNRRKVKYQK